MSKDDLLLIFKDRNQGNVQSRPSSSHHQGNVGPTPSGGGGGGGGRGWSGLFTGQPSGGQMVGPTKPVVAVTPRPRVAQSPESSRQASVTPSMQSLSIAHSSTSRSAQPGDMIPIRRPDKGGTLEIQRLRLNANFFAVKYKHEAVIWHYDLAIEPVENPLNNRPIKLTKADYSLIRNKLSSTNPTEFPLSMTAFDGVRNIFSCDQLPTGEFQVLISRDEGKKAGSFVCTLKLVGPLRLSKLTDYLRGCGDSVPRDILQGMDVIMNEHPTRHMIRVGRRFHSTKPEWNNDIGEGIVASGGFQQSSKPTAQGLALCLDYSVLAFRKPISVIQFLEEHIRGFNMNNFHQFKSDVEYVLTTLKVTFTYRVTNLDFTVVGLTEKATKDISFPLTDRESDAPPRDIGLVEFFREKYEKDIRYLNVPCLELGKARKTAVPLEFCKLVAGQKCSKELLGKDLDKRLRNFSLIPPQEREKKICRMVQDKDGPRGGEITRSFGIEVNPNMTKVMGRVLRPPEIKLKSRGLNGQVVHVPVDKMKRQWNLVDKAVIEGVHVQRWGVLDFSSESGRFRFNPNQVIPNLIGRCESLGIRMEEPIVYENTSMNVFYKADAMRLLLDKVYKKAKGSLQILVCVMANEDPGYNYLKWYSETKLGLLTQCCLSSSINNARGQDQYLANLALKINAKLGGSNFELAGLLPKIGGQKHVMFIGADVNHPGSGNKTSPSVAAVVATMNWPAINRYAARIWPQDHRTENISKFGAKCLELVEAYANLNKVKPDKIVVFRDGVSEGQFDMALNWELMEMKQAFREMHYFPTITLIVAQKRHHARLFPDNGTGNVPPGTVVDTGITHQTDFDFYLSSHFGNIGTSKPTHYQVLLDEHKFNSNDLQQLIYNLCFTFARCSKPVSLAPPVYYADLVAYRGQLYHKALLMEQPDAFEAAFDERHYKQPPSIENSMYFI
ncbi:hypothetical protein ACFE04_015809 [Oxalis oulophora]